MKNYMDFHQLTIFEKNQYWLKEVGERVVDMTKKQNNLISTTGQVFFFLTQSIIFPVFLTWPNACVLNFKYTYVTICASRML